MVVVVGGGVFALALSASLQELLERKATQMPVRIYTCG